MCPINWYFGCHDINISWLRAGQASWRRVAPRISAASTLSPAMPFAFHALQAPQHPSMEFTCAPCKKGFKTQESLERHVKDSPRHRPDQYCEACDRYFKNAESLQQHIQESKAHKTTPTVVAEPDANNTPLDKFFLSFPSFSYDPSRPPAESYSLLRRHMAWSRNSAEGESAWRRYREALVAEVRIWFGSEDDLSAWHTLCRAIGIQQPPDTIKGCVAVSGLP